MVRLLFLALRVLGCCLTVFPWGQVQDQSDDRATLNSYLLSENPHLSEHAYVLLASKWPKNDLNVCWENPSPEFAQQMAIVKKEVEDSWVSHSYLTFSGWERCAENNSGIRILIDDSGPMTRFLGRQLDNQKNGMVLNFTFKAWGNQCQATLEYCVKVIAGHEFGHAVGFQHENDRPDKPVPNRPGECLPTPGDSTYHLKGITPYDPSSIMNYCNKDYNNNGQLSALDIEAVKKLYPPKRPIYRF